MQALEKGTVALLDHAITLSYYMRGAVQYEDIFDLVYLERLRMMNFVNKRIETEMEKVKKTKGKLHAIY